MTTQLPVYTVSNNCQDCYKCIRQCPVKAIRVEHSRAGIIEDLCISCGHCTVVCPAGAKRYRSDLQLVTSWIDAGEEVVLSVAPSIYAFIGGGQQEIIDHLWSLGFSRVSETAWGAVQTSKATAQWLENFVGNVAISTACPSVVSLVEKYYPQFIHSLAPVASPMLMHGAMLKRAFGADVKVVFAGPCIAKKLEASCGHGEIDATLTISELLQLPSVRPPDSHHVQGWYPGAADGSSRCYPLEGGMIGSIDFRNLTFQPAAFSGLQTCMKILDDLSLAPLSESVFLELLACEGGCFMGPGTPTAGSAIRRKRGIERKSDDVNLSIAHFDIPEVLPDRAGLPTGNITHCVYSETDVISALESVGKHTLSDELNCGGCGYDCCREFAIALLEGKAERTMCVSYMRRVAQDKASVLLEKMPYGVVIVDDKLRIVDANRNFATMLGAEIEEAFEARPGLESADLRKIIGFYKIFSSSISTGEEIVEHDIRQGDQYFHVSIVTILKYKLVCGIMQNMKDERTRREMATDRVQQVITQNMKVVQQIAFLLGENAAFTETMLNSVIDSHDAG
ncbi:MAG: hypothetical protein A2X11_04290 [Bacteroidetes bacterium GWE2_42_24]|nr:MAG: hypothetical protein A2X11_04290 [Bacteroidetes bacterium GWE2_42_24]OFY25252.1 MAG: hypothetical protein A2X09_11005 [Bacteroidetes bacterium GWF2_43_11]